MSALTDLRDNLVADLVNITDAAYPGDPAGTPANEAYFVANVHNFLKALGQAMLPGRKFIVSPKYAGLGNPFYTTIALAFAAVTGSSSSNKQLIFVEPSPTSYSDPLVIDSSQWVEFSGAGKYTSVISGAVAISNGVSIFRGIGFQSDISINGGVAIFEDCTQPTGVFNLNGGSVIISNCSSWGFITSLNNGSLLFLEGVKSVKKGTGGDLANSVTLNAGITTGTYVFNDVRLEGAINNPSSVTIEESNVKTDATARPSY